MMYRMKISRCVLIIVLLMAVLGVTACAPVDSGNSGTPDTPQQTGTDDTQVPPQGDLGYEFKYWNDGAKSLYALTSFVQKVTSEDSDDFIPVEDRIAVFDMDGTLLGELCPTYFEYMLLYHRLTEDKNYKANEAQKIVAKELADVINGTAAAPDHLPMDHALAAAQAYSGMTLSEFDQYVKDYAKTKVAGFKNMTWADAFYLPMQEVVSYLQKNGFTVYIVSGSDRYLCRSLVEGHLDIQANNVIGMDVVLNAKNQGYVDGLDYTYTFDDELVRGDEMLIKNLKMNKVFLIAQEIGKQPVLSFGNSSGDQSMATYVIDENPYPSMAFMLVADDDVQDYGDPQKAAGLKEKWTGLGFTVISMKDDFKTIYKEDVIKKEQ